MAKTMRAVAIKNDTGPLENLYIDTSTPIPTPTGSQALVKVSCFGLNRMDLLQREGRYPVPPQAPSTLGVEFSGVIHSLPPDTSSSSSSSSTTNKEHFKEGDEVFGLAYGGAYAEYIAVSTHMLIRKPASLSHEECAGIPETWITATQAMYLIGNFKPGDSILWHAGASSVSIAGQQLSRVNGAGKVFSTTRSDDKCKFCVEQLGATKSWNSTTTAWEEEVKKATDGKGVDIIVDFIGPTTFAQNLDAAARDGRIVNLATLGGMKLSENDRQPNFGNFVAKRLRYEGSSLRSRDEEYQGKLRDQLVEHAMPMFEDGRLKSIIEKVYPWEQIQEAHRQMEGNQTMGKLICRID